MFGRFVEEKWSSISGRPYFPPSRRDSGDIGPKAVRAKLRALLSEIETAYDMRHFDLADFGNWVASREGRRLESVGMPLSSAIFGCWFSTEDVHYIFYDSEVHPIHQSHIRLHELSHILCGHQTGHLGKGTREEIERVFTNVIERFAHDGAKHTKVRSGLLRSTQSDQEELEAELLSDMIVEAIFAHRRSAELTQPISFSNLVVETYEAMGWT